LAARAWLEEGREIDLEIAVRDFGDDKAKGKTDKNGSGCVQVKPPAVNSTRRAKSMPSPTVSFQQAVRAGCCLPVVKQPR
jgi:hypothetical protein